MAEELGCDLPPPRESLVSAEGAFVEKSEVSATRVEGRPIGESVPKEAESSNKYRLDALKSARQPSYGKRTQLIDEGLHSPSEHLRRAKLLNHPFDDHNGLKADHTAALDFMSKDPETINSRRLDTLRWLEREASRLEQAQAQDNSRASWTARKLGLRPKTALMRRLQELLGLEDTMVPDACLMGLGIIGQASKSPFFADFEVPPSVSKEEYYSGMQDRSQNMMERVQYMAQKSSPEQQHAIWEKTQKRKSSKGQ